MGKLHFYGLDSHPDGLILMMDDSLLRRRRMSDMWRRLLLLLLLLNDNLLLLSRNSRAFIEVENHRVFISLKFVVPLKE